MVIPNPRERARDLFLLRIERKADSSRQMPRSE
jgi:hypothetical protein